MLKIIKIFLLTVINAWKVSLQNEISKLSKFETLVIQAAEIQKYNKKKNAIGYF